MKKSTTFLTLAGVLALTGCTTKVMDDRYYETPRDDAGKPIQVDSVANPRPMPIEPEKVPLQNKKGGSAYDPMEVRELDKVGLGDNSASCPKGKRQPKGKGKAIKAAGTTVAPAGFYIVKRNDTLSKIAQKHRVSLAALLKANNLTKANAHRLQIGQKLVIPQAQGKKNPAPQQKKKGKKIATGTAAVAASGNRNADGTYTVQSGDNIPKIARKLGVGSRTLQKANNLSDEATRKLRVGQKLVIPVGDKATTITQKSVAKPKPQQQTPASQLPPAENTTTVTGTQDTTQTQQPTTTNTQQTSGVAPDSGVNSGEASTDFVPVGDAKTLEEVAAKHGTTVEKLRQLNASYANTDKLEPGSYIFVPRK